MTKVQPLRERLEAKLDKNAGPDGCWPFTGCVLSTGYGQIGTSGKKRQGAHRVAFLLAGGVLTPKKPWVLHTCDNRACCNSRHLYAGTAQNNMDDMVRRGRDDRGYHGRKTHCPQGHPYSGLNLYVRSTGSRECRSCVRASGRRYKARQRAATT